MTGYPHAYPGAMPYAGGMPTGADPYTYPGAMPYAGMPTGADPYAYPGAMPYAGMSTGANPYSPSVSRKQELDFLREQAQNIKSQLEQIAARIKELEAEE